MTAWVPRWRNGRPVEQPPDPGLAEWARLSEEIIHGRAPDAPDGGPVPLYGEHGALGWAGPDPVVFGTLPRVKGWNWL